MIQSNRPQTSDYLPARMLNEFTYCPRLFFYEHVEGVFAHNQETIEGAIRHKRVDAKQDELPSAADLQDSDRPVAARSVTLSSDTHGVIAKMDLLEADGDTVTPVDYKRGRPRELPDGSLDAWDTDKTQLAVGALVLRENGYTCDEAVVFYATTKQRVRFAVDEELTAETIALIERARRVMGEGVIPPPLDDSPKCPRCSLVGICLPDETRRATLAESGESIDAQRTLFDVEPRRQATLDLRTSRNGELRRLVPARDDLRPLYLNTPGLYVGKSGNVLKIKEKDKVVQEVRLNEISQLNLMGNIQISTQAIQT